MSFEMIYHQQKQYFQPFPKRHKKSALNQIFPQFGCAGENLLCVADVLLLRVSHLPG